MTRDITTPSPIRSDEKVLMTLHQHWIVLIFNIGYILGLIFTTGVIFMLKGTLIAIFGTAVFWGFLSLYWMLFLTFILLSWVNNELDLFIITDQRIIGIEQLSSLSRRVSECGLDRVQEVNAEVSGILQTLLGYGRVHIHTASEHSDMIVNFAPDPAENGNRINSIISDYRSHHPINRAPTI